MSETSPRKAARTGGLRRIVRTRTLPSDVITPIGAYLALRERGASCLLESVEQGGRLSRYSFVGLDYVAAESLAESPDLYERIRTLLDRYRPHDDPSGLGGALLVAAYDAARPMAHLPSRTTDAPAAPAAYVAVPATWLVFDHFTHTLVLWGSGGEAAQIDSRLERYAATLLEQRPQLAAGVRAVEPVRASLTHREYVERAMRVKDAIREGEVYQLQLGVRFSAELRGEPFDAYRALRRVNPSPYMFFVDTPFGELFGASPEFLVRLDGRHARIRPLAGTRSRGADDVLDARIEAELLSNEKERAEHVMLVDLGRNDLGAVCEYGSVSADELLQIERFSHVMHIVSALSGTLREDCDALDLFRAAFPAGTVTGTPKIRAMQLIDALEPVTRGAYAGSIGRLAFTGDFDSCITLRSIHTTNGRAWWQASAGIVADSDPDAEYAEVLHKTRVARSVLGVELPREDGD